MKTFYSPTFIDESMTFPDKKGISRPTGKRSGFIFTRRFYKTVTGKWKASRGLIPFSWEEDTDESKYDAIHKAIEGMEELPDLEKNPPIQWIPEQLKSLN